MRHINHCNTLQDRAVPTDGSFGIPYFMKTRMTGSGTERKGKRGIYSHWQTGNYRAKLANASFRTARPGPFGFRGKIILARRACGIFPANLACTGHDLLWPVVTGTPAPKSRITKNKLLCHSR